MTTFTAFTTLPDKDAAEALGAALETLPTEPCGVGVFEIEDGSGSIKVSGVGGNIAIDDGSGGITVKGVAGSVTVDDGSGSIDVSDVEEDLIIVDDGSGGLDFSNIGGRVQKDS